MKNQKVLLFYLTSNDRYFIFEEFVKSLNDSGVKSHIYLLIVSSVNNFEIFKFIISRYDISHDIVCVPCPWHDYLPKVRFAINYAVANDYKYVWKCDNDMIIPEYTFRALVESVSLLDDPKNLALVPAISTGIPTIDGFCESFLKENEKVELFSEFRRCVFTNMQDVFDYTYLNDFMAKFDNWNGTEFYSELKRLSSSMQVSPKTGRTVEGYLPDYLGMHPIRYGYGNDLLNRYIISRAEFLYAEKPFYPELLECNYLCDMCFIIRTSYYQHLIQKENFIVDGCDEVPLNRMRWKYKLNFIVLKNAFAVHPTYNLKWKINIDQGGGHIDAPLISLEQYEAQFLADLVKSRKPNVTMAYRCHPSIRNG